MYEKLFWLHVPIEMMPGKWFTIPPGGRLTVLGRAAQLQERPMRLPDALGSPIITVVRQWLLFDPMPRAEAESVLAELRAKFPVLAFRHNWGFRISSADLCEAPSAPYDGKIPTLIPGDLKPNPVFADATHAGYTDATMVLERSLSEIPSLTDPRILTALDLEIGSQYETLPRSEFLTQMTILDYLAIQTDRSRAIQDWLTEKIVEARQFKDEALVNSLNGLRRTSHRTAIRALVERAAAQTGNRSEQPKLSALAVKLYDARSNMSHEGGQRSDTDELVEQADRLVQLVLDAAIAEPTILDSVTRPEPASESPQDDA